MSLDRHPVLLGQGPPPLRDPVGQRKAPDVVQQPGRMRELLLVRAHPHGLAHVARKAGYCGRMARGPLVADVERTHESSEHAPGE